MKCHNYLLPLILICGCTQNQSFNGYRTESDNSTAICSSESYVGYTNHWQNNYHKSYRYGNLIKYSITDVDKASQAAMINAASDLGLTGLQMECGFVKAVLSKDCKVLDNPDLSQFKSATKSSQDILVFAQPGTEVGDKLSKIAPVVEEIGNYQSKERDLDVIKAFVLKKGKRRIYAVVGNESASAQFKSVLENARNVLENYDMKRGWFGASTNQTSVTCNFGDELEVIGKGMNEGNSWFVFSGPFEFLNQKNLKNWIDEIGNPVVVDNGYAPLFGSDFSEFQVQLMNGSQDYLEYRKKHGGYIAASLPSDTILPEDENVDLYYANKGIVKSLNRLGKPFVVTTSDLLGGTTECMVLFVPKGREFNRDEMWKAILECRAVAVLEGETMTGPDQFRKTLELLAIDRDYIEDYYADKVNMTVNVVKHHLVVDIENCHSYSISGDVSMNLPQQIAEGKHSSEHIKLAPGAKTQVVLDIAPSPEAMGRNNAVIAKVDWGKGTKSVMAFCDLPPAVSVHHLLYGNTSGCDFPVGIHNISDDSNIKVSLSVLDSNNDNSQVYCEEKIVDVKNGDYADLDFRLMLPKGSYLVKTEAMGVTAETQLGIGAASGEVTVREVDLNADGVNEYELENSKVKVTLLCTGARIIEYKVKGVDDNIFFKLWPDLPCDVNRPYRDHGFWPFGGFEDFLGQGSVETHKVYDAEITRNDGQCAEVTMTADYYGNRFQKTFSLYGDMPLVGIRFALDFINPELDVLGPQPILVLGKSHGVEDKFFVPEMDGIGTYVMNPNQMYGKMMDIKEGWNAGYDTKENVSFVGAYPVDRPDHLHMWMNLDTNGESHYPYVEFQPWLPIYTGNTTFFSYYMWADGSPWEKSLQELKDRNLITVRK